MIDMHCAIELATKYFWAKGNQTITKFYESESAWIVFGGKNGQIKFGNAGISIDKATGEISKFILPSKTNFEILEKAKLLDIRYEVTTWDCLIEILMRRHM